MLSQQSWQCKLRKETSLWMAVPWFGDGLEENWDDETETESKPHFHLLPPPPQAQAHHHRHKHTTTSTTTSSSNCLLILPVPFQQLVVISVWMQLNTFLMLMIPPPLVTIFRIQNGTIFL